MDGRKEGGEECRLVEVIYKKPRKDGKHKCQHTAIVNSL